MEQQQQQQQQGTFKGANTYQQLRYLYQTENYGYFFDLIGQFEQEVRKNRELKNKVFDELLYLQTKMLGTPLDASKEYLEELWLLKDKYKLPIGEGDNELEELQRTNQYLKHLLLQKIEYNRQLLDMVQEYQQSTVVIIKSLYKLYEDQGDDLREKLNVLAELRQQLLDEFNQKTHKLSTLSQLNDIIL